MIDSSFPSQGKERHLSSEGRTQMADVVNHPKTEESLESAMKGAAGQAANERALREPIQKLDPTNLDFGLFRK